VKRQAFVVLWQGHAKIRLQTDGFGEGFRGLLKSLIFSQESLA